MENSITDILNNLSKGKCNVETALDQISNVKPSIIEEKKENIISDNKKCAKRIKIFIDAANDEKESKRIRINIPAISIRFLKRILRFVAKIGVKYSTNSTVVDENETIKDGKDLIDPKNLDKIFDLFDALTMLPPFEIINVESPDATVHIYTK